MKLESVLDAKKTYAGASSSGCAGRPSGVSAPNSATSSAGRQKARFHTRASAYSVSSDVTTDPATSVQAAAEGIAPSGAALARLDQLERLFQQLAREAAKLDEGQLQEFVNMYRRLLALATALQLGAAQTVELLESTRFDFAYLFKYSERSHTWAARNAPDDVPEALKGSRLKKIIELQESICAEVFTSRIGTTQKVLVDGESRRDSEELCGRTDDFKMTVFPKPASGVVVPGDIVTVQIDDATSHTLRGTVAEG